MATTEQPCCARYTVAAKPAPPVPTTMTSTSSSKLSGTATGGIGAASGRSAPTTRSFRCFVTSSSSLCSSSACGLLGAHPARAPAAAAVTPIATPPLRKLRRMTSIMFSPFSKDIWNPPCLRRGSSPPLLKRPYLSVLAKLRKQESTPRNRIVTSNLDAAHGIRLAMSSRRKKAAPKDGFREALVFRAQAKADRFATFAKSKRRCDSCSMQETDPSRAASCSMIYAITKADEEAPPTQARRFTSRGGSRLTAPPTTSRRRRQPCRTWRASRYPEGRAKRNRPR